MLLKNKEEFLSLVRLGIGHRADALPQTIDWQSLKDFAEEQGLSAVVLDGIEKLSEEQRPPKVFLLEWIGETLQGYEYRYELYCRAIAELAEFYNSQGFKIMVLKGYACSIDWPKPEHRPCGDIDIWQFGLQKEADATLAKEKGVEIDASHHHHTVFYWRDFMVENHYDFINVHQYESSRKLEKVFKELGKDDSHAAELFGENVYLPSPNLHALFLLRHNVAHFASSNINLRQVLDWGFFVKKHTKEIDWVWLETILKEYHMKDFFNIINAICVEELGFDQSIFMSDQYLPELKQKVLDDILYPKFGAAEPEFFISRLLYKLRRWQGNAWKQKLCYSESRWKTFWSGLKAHVIKPNV